MKIVEEFVDLVNAVAEFYGISPNRIANMDQTAVKFNMTPTRTWAKKGMRTIPIKAPQTTGGSHTMAN